MPMIFSYLKYHWTREIWRGQLQLSDSRNKGKEQKQGPRIATWKLTGEHLAEEWFWEVFSQQLSRYSEWKQKKKRAEGEFQKALKHPKDPSGSGPWYLEKLTTNFGHYRTIGLKKERGPGMMRSAPSFIQTLHMFSPLFNIMEVKYLIEHVNWEWI